MIMKAEIIEAVALILGVGGAVALVWSIAGLVALVLGKSVAPFFRVELKPDDLDGLTAFQNEYFRRAGMLVPMSYLQQARVVVFFVGLKRVGGYALNMADWAPMRYFVYFSGRLKNQILEEAGLTETQLLELTCIWKAKTLSPTFSGLFYLSAMADAYRTGRQYGKSHLIGGSVLRQIRHVQRQLMNIDLFIGSLQDADITKHNDDLVAIYACELDKLPGRVVWLFLSRFVFRANLLRKIWRQVKRSSGGAGSLVTSN